MITVILPYCLLTILFIRGVTLSGSGEGIWYYLNPDFSKILNFEIWVTAATQVLFSLSPCMGILVSFASFLPKKSPTIKDSLIICLTNSFTSIYAGFVVFAVLGYAFF